MDYQAKLSSTCAVLSGNLNYWNYNIGEFPRGVLILLSLILSNL